MTVNNNKKIPENKRTLFPFQGNSKPKGHFLSPPPRLQTFDCCGNSAVQKWQQQQLTCSHRQETFLKKSTVATQWSLQYCSNPPCSPVKITNGSDTETAQKRGLSVQQLILKREQEVCGEKHSLVSQSGKKAYAVLFS